MLEISGGDAAEIMSHNEHTLCIVKSLGYGQQTVQRSPVQRILQGLPLCPAHPLVELLGTAAACHSHLQALPGVYPHDQVVLKGFFQCHVAVQPQPPAEVEHRHLRGAHFFGKVLEGEKAALFRIVENKVGNPLARAAERAVPRLDLFQNVHVDPF